MSTRRTPEIEAVGDRAVRLALPAGTGARAALDALRACSGVVDAVVTERHALVVARDETAIAGVAEEALRALARAGRDARAPSREHRVPVRYDGEDLARVAAFAGVSPAEAAALHAGRAYVVACVGFLPGFAYLAEVDPRIAAPRLAAPRARVPAGAVGVAGGRTGVYPLASPGGWNLVGTAIDFAAFDPTRGAALALGDRVRFEGVA